MASKIVSLEQQTLRLLEAFPSVHHLTQGLREQPRKHNATTIDKMEEALFVLRAQELTPDSQEIVRKLQKMFKRAESVGTR